MTERRRLGRTDIELSPIGLGCWQFSSGFGRFKAYWSVVSQDTVNEIVARSLALGIDWFDTAEFYGGGLSEEALSRALVAAGQQPGQVKVATKWMPLMRTASSILTTIDERRRRLAPFPVDLFQVHQPLGFSSVEAEMRAMAKLVELKKIRAVGVSNFSARLMRRAHVELQKHGLVLASNQVEYSLLSRGIERRGVIAAAKELGVTVIAYSPLAQGVLSGRFHEDPEALKHLVGPRRWRGVFRKLERSRPLIDELRAVAKAHGATVAQVALAWVLQFHGDTVVAIPGATKTYQVEDNAAAMQLTLTRAELDAIDARATSL